MPKKKKKLLIRIKKKKAVFHFVKLVNEKPWYPTHHFEYLEKSPAWDPKEQNLALPPSGLVPKLQGKEEGISP